MAAAAAPGAIFGGLISLGDRRVNPLLNGVEPSVSEAALNIAVLCRTGVATIGAFEFWLDRIEYWNRARSNAKCEHEAFTADSRLGIVASGLGLLLRDSQSRAFD